MLKWGIIGLGNIAHSFASDLALLKDHQLVSVASRSIEKAKDFSEKHRARKAHGSYDDILKDQEVDIIYIATPHHSHASLSVAALKAGKHVLCEKPIAVNSSQLKEMIDTSRKQRKFLMEALWTRFNPSIRKILELLDKDEIGEVNYINADFCFSKDAGSESRLFNMDLAGGALLDTGVYPLFLSYAILGVPEKIIASAKFHETGADIQTAMQLIYPGGMSNLMCSFQSESDMVAKISGKSGIILIDARWHHTQGFTVIRSGRKEHYSFPTLGKGFSYEIQECKICIDQNKIESSMWSHQNSLDLLMIADRIRDQIALVYPFE